MSTQQNEKAQQDQQVQGQTGEQQYSQTSIDRVFGQITAGQPEAVREAWSAYFDLAEQTLRTARRVSEVQTLALMKDQIVQAVVPQVIRAIQQDPSLLSHSQQR